MKFESEVVVTTNVTNLFIHGFHKNKSVARKLIQTTFNHKCKKKQKTLKSFETDFWSYGLKTFESDCIHINETWQLGPCILRLKSNSTTLADKEQRVITWDLRSISEERNSE